MPGPVAPTAATRDLNATADAASRDVSRAMRRFDAAPPVPGVREWVPGVTAGSSGTGERTGRRDREESSGIGGRKRGRRWNVAGGAGEATRVEPEAAARLQMRDEAQRRCPHHRL